MHKWLKTFFLLLPGCLVFLGSGDGNAGSRFLRMSDFGGNGAYINLIVRQVRVTPIRAHPGDIIRIDMAIENRGDDGHDTIPIEVRANGKVVASKLFTYGIGSEPGKIYRETLLWNTRGVAPGEYRIRGEVFLWYDASEFDNLLDVEEPLVLVPAGTAFPDGKEVGGTGVAADPRWKPGRAGGDAAPGRY